MAKIRAVVVEGNRERGYKRVQVLFGTNSFVEITEHEVACCVSSAPTTAACRLTAPRRPAVSRSSCTS